MGTVSAVFLAAVLVVAAIGKLRRPDLTAAGMAELGLPAAGSLRWAVPGAEGAVAGLLVTVPGWGGVAAFALLAAFTVVLITTIRAGRLVPCRCFGGTDRSPVSWRHVVRNVWLLGHAAVATTVTSLRWPSVPETVGAAAMLAVGPIAIGVVGRRSKVAP